MPKTKRDGYSKTDKNAKLAHMNLYGRPNPKDTTKYNEWIQRIPMEGGNPLGTKTREERVKLIEKTRRIHKFFRPLYASRKEFADIRPRVGGRFVKGSPYKNLAVKAAKTELKPVSVSEEISKIPPCEPTVPVFPALPAYPTLPSVNLSAYSDPAPILTDQELEFALSGIDSIPPAGSDFALTNIPNPYPEAPYDPSSSPGAAVASVIKGRDGMLLEGSAPFLTLEGLWSRGSMGAIPRDKEEQNSEFHLPIFR